MIEAISEAEVCDSAEGVAVACSIYANNESVIPAYVCASERRSSEETAARASARASSTADVDARARALAAMILGESAVRIASVPCAFEIGIPKSSITITSFPTCRDVRDAGARRVSDTPDICT
jgi:hypothetical protein